jgi:hypothetical protein
VNVEESECWLEGVPLPLAWVLQEVEALFAESTGDHGTFVI